MIKSLGGITQIASSKGASMSYGDPADLNMAMTEVVERMKPRAGSFQRPLSAKERDCAVTEAKNPMLSFDDLASMFNEPLSWVMELHERQDYREMLATSRIEEQKKVSALSRVLTVEEIEELFNREIERSIIALTEIRDNRGETSNNRIKASALILEYAPKAPTKKSEQQSPNIVIQVPWQQVETIRAAAEDMEDPDLIELLEGEGYTTEPPSPPDIPPPVRTKASKRKKRGKNVK